MRLDIVTIFPEYLEPLNVSLVGKARARGRLDLRVHDLRDWTHDRHRTVDDTPYGGGPGMVMKPEPWGEALDAVIGSGQSVGPVPAGAPAPSCGTLAVLPAPSCGTDAVSSGTTAPSSGSPAPSSGAVASGESPDRPALVVPTPSGRPFTQALAVELSERPWLVFAPARYEGIDRRVIEEYAERLDVYEVSIGDYVLAGGEAAVLVIVEAVARLLPGVLGNAESHRDDSFAPGAMADLLEGPVYTKPPEWRGRGVPEVLLSGHHGRVARWRRDEALRRTARNRPDLIERCDPADFDTRDREVLAELGWAPDSRGATSTTPDGPRR
jgi:tRNA (guanine37-N1)-methyltransferase